MAVRKPDAERTRLDILRVARQEFAEHGLSGARVDAIAAKTQTTKRMIYYYFGSKEGLYLEVLEGAYKQVRDAENTLELSTLPPDQAIRKLIDATFDFHDSTPDFGRLISIENIHHGRYLKGSDTIRGLNVTVLEVMSGVIERGKRLGVFTTNYNVLDLHLLITSMCFYRVSNRHTFGTLFDLDLQEAGVKQRHKRIFGDAILGLLGYHADSKHETMADT